MEEILNKKGIKESSSKLYLSNLKRLNNGVLPKTLTFLKNTKKILDFIKDKQPNTQRTYLISICTVLSDNETYKKQYNEYYTLLKDSNNLLKNNTTKSEKQEENWISEEDINKIYNEYKENAESIISSKRKKLNEKDYNVILSYLILSLYLLIPPRRSLDYIKMLIGVDSDKDYNYLDVNTSKFYFNNYKTSGKYACQVVDIPNNLMDVIKLYLLKRSGTKKDLFFLVKYNGEPFKDSSVMTRLLNKIFKKKVSVSMLRNIYLTEKYSKQNKEKEEDAKAMGTSTNMIDTQYTKQEI